MLTGTGNKLEHRFALQAAVRGDVPCKATARGKGVELSWDGARRRRGAVAPLGRQGALLISLWEPRRDETHKVVTLELMANNDNGMNGKGAKQM
ncbi:hypothetical protein EYF80_016949 [Liparis tanakae]|uniref:Uncharacterized protein n=1 Tax=Liparis tanakae TaxID=230148 RepID=A0A4Z2I4F2_9TELE|nr:hypothetical protein EYF80_016949 [Liparis tanakae]